MKTESWSRVLLVVFACLVIVGTALAGLPSRDTRYHDPLDEKIWAPGEADTPFENGEGVSFFNGNLQVLHETSPAYPLDGGGWFALVRAYNGNSLHVADVYNNGVASRSVLLGKSWVGWGWRLHLGRYFSRGNYNGGNYDLRESLWELPTGELIPVSPKEKKAYPQLKSIWCGPDDSPERACCKTGKCVEYPICDPPPPPAECAGEDPNTFLYFATFPDGSKYRMERLVDEDPDTTTLFTLNQDRSGLYPTRITDVFGNSIDIAYWGPGTPFPEAIRTVTRTPNGGSPVVLIETELCEAIEAGRCPAEAQGMLKRLTALGPHGHSVYYDLAYGTATVPVGGSSVTIALLQTVSKSGSDGSVGGQVVYGYGAGLPSEGITADNGPLLDRITYPHGSMSAYAYGPFTSGRRRVSGVDVDRVVVGVTRRVLFPDGWTMENDGSAVRARWSWTRAFSLPDCSTAVGETNTLTNDYVLVDPTGVRRHGSYWGSPCGYADEPFLDDPWGPHGVLKTLVLADAANTPLRTVEYGYDGTVDPADGELLKPILEATITTFHDDLVVDGTASNPRQMTARAAGRTQDSVWSEQVLENGRDGTNPDRGYLRKAPSTSAWPSVTTRTDFDRGCWTAKDIVGPYSRQEITDGIETVATDTGFTCTGKLESATPRSAWSGDPGTADPTLTLGYDSRGNLQSSSWSGGETYSSGSRSAPSYSTTYTSANGLVQTATQGNLPWKSKDVTIDTVGFITASRDPAGVATSYEFDAFGRLRYARPAGTESATGLYYPDLWTVRSSTPLADPGGARSSSSSTQVHRESILDNRGRVKEEWRALPGSTRAVRVSRYDELDRKVFESVWLSESAYSGTGSWAVDRNGGGDDYRIDGVPVQGANRPLGTVIFFGTRKPGCGAHNPLCSYPDPLGRVRRIENPDGSVADISYVGPHETVAIYQDADGNGVADAGTDPPVIYKYYRDGLGRTVMVDAPSGADAIYDYNVTGKLTRVRLVSQLPEDPFTKWLNNDALLAPSVLQERSFTFDAQGRLRSATVPESGRAAAGGVTSYLAYDNAGNLLEWEDPLAAARGATFRQYFDVAGRRTALTRVKTSASRPLADDAGGFEIDTSNWKEGWGDSWFTFGNTAWEIVPYSALPGVSPPSSGSGTSALHFGSAGGYDGDATGVQSIRRRVDGVGRDDVLSFEVWRQVREGVSSLDRLEVAVALVDHGNDQDTNYRRIVLTLDSSHSSFPRWQRYSLRPMDLLANNITQDDFSHDIYVLFSFDKRSMTPSTNPLVGVVIDNVRLGRDAEEVIGEWAYDGNEPDADGNPLTHSITGPLLAQSQLDAVEATDRKQGKLTAAIGYLDGQPVDVRRFVYRGLNGRLSGEEHDIDWTAAAGRDLASGWARWVSRYVYGPHGGIERLVAPAIPGDTFERAVSNSYNREFLGGIDVPEWGAVLSSVWYGENGAVTRLLFGNNTEETVTLDEIGRLQSMQVLRPAQSGLISAWNSGNFAFDGRGNITAIGAQTFIYDSADRLIDAKVLPQAQNPGQTVPEHLTYTHDEYGNVTSQDRVSGFLSQIPTGLEFSRTYDAKNHPEPVSGTFAWSFDLNGNATRYPGKAGQDVSSIWTDLNQLAGFFEGSIDTVSAVPALRSIYGVDGLRVVTQALGRPGEEGWPRLTLRDPGGRPLAEFVQRPDRPQPSLDRDFIYGVGRLLAERQPSTAAPTATASAPLASNGNFNFGATGGPATYTADIVTASGWTNGVPGIQVDASGAFALPESAFPASEVSFLRLKQETPEVTGYSAPVAVRRIAGVTGSSPNQVRAVAVSRQGNNVVVRWALQQDNAKKFRVYFRRADGAATYLLTPMALASSTRSYTLAAQALGAPCGTISISQLDASLQNETAGTAGTDVPTSTPGSAGRGCDCPPCAGGGGGGGNPPAPDSWVETYHHRDHLGSLRVITDEAGQVVDLLDYYPYGQELVCAGEPGTASRRKYTGHERDEAPGLDYMLARYKPAFGTSFLSPDPIDDVSLAVPRSWNKYAYAKGSPLIFVDPFGLATMVCIYKDGKLHCEVTVTGTYSSIPRIGLPGVWVPPPPGVRGPGPGGGGSQDPATPESPKEVCRRAIASVFGIIDARSVNVGFGATVGFFLGADGSAAFGIDSGGDIYGTAAFHGILGSYVGGNAGGVIVASRGAAGDFAGWSHEAVAGGTAAALAGATAEVSYTVPWGAPLDSGYISASVQPGPGAGGGWYIGWGLTGGRKYANICDLLFSGDE